jgi:SAM-dependent methyltransferase
MSAGEAFSEGCTLMHDRDVLRAPSLEFIDDAARHSFTFIDPPFQFNAPNVALYPPEVSGHHLLRSMTRRLGWNSLSGKRMLDVGCGVRFARAIINLGLDIGLYVGADVNRDSIAWLQAKVADERFTFVHVNDYNPLYNPGGDPAEDYASLRPFADRRFDVACMFSVITHQRPDEARRTFELLHDLMKGTGLLYFTAFLDTRFADYGEAAEQISLKSTYNPTYLTALCRDCGWDIERFYMPAPFQQHAIVCRASS